MNKQQIEISTESALIGRFKKIKHGLQEIAFDSLSNEIQFNSHSNKMYVNTETGDSNINLPRFTLLENNI